jgi:hypothetical protein
MLYITLDLNQASSLCNASPSLLFQALTPLYSKSFLIFPMSLLSLTAPIMGSISSTSEDSISTQVHKLDATLLQKVWLKNLKSCNTLFG